MDWYLLHTLPFYEPWKYVFVTKVARTWRGESGNSGFGVPVMHGSIQSCAKSIFSLT